MPQAAQRPWQWSSRASSSLGSAKRPSTCLPRFGTRQNPEPSSFADSLTAWSSFSLTSAVSTTTPAGCSPQPTASTKTLWATGSSRSSLLAIAGSASTLADSSRDIRRRLTEGGTVSFEVYLQGDEAQTDRLPRKADIERAFEGLIRDDETDLQRLVVGPSESDRCAVYYSEGDVQSSLMVERPVAQDWLWERLFGMLRDFDLFLFWPDDELTAVVAREEVPLPDGMPAKKVVVRSGHELEDAIGGA